MAPDLLNTSLPGTDLLSVERSRHGFVLHRRHGESKVYVRSRDRRHVERIFRDLGITIVDEWGARIDESQFEKESDPTFNRKAGSGWRSMYESLAPLTLINWRLRRDMRQSSDDG